MPPLVKGAQTVGRVAQKAATPARTNISDPQTIQRTRIVQKSAVERRVPTADPSLERDVLRDSRPVRSYARAHEGENIVEDADEFRSEEGRGKKWKGIGWGQGAAMIAVAAFFDFLQFLLTFLVIGIIINPILSFIFFLIFVTWFSANGVSFTSGRGLARAGILSAGFISELIPFLNVMPGWTVSITLIVGLSRRG